jgi:hypothetical protein
VGRSGSLWGRSGLLWIVVGRSGSLWGRSGSLWIVVGRCGSLWVVVGCCGSFRVLVTTSLQLRLIQRLLPSISACSSSELTIITLQVLEKSSAIN